MFVRKVFIKEDLLNFEVLVRKVSIKQGLFEVFVRKVFIKEDLLNFEVFVRKVFIKQGLFEVFVRKVSIKQALNERLLLLLRHLVRIDSLVQCKADLVLHRQLLIKDTLHIPMCS